MARADTTGDPAPYRHSLATVLTSAAVPYGVTLTVWASGASLSHFRGAPKLFEIFLFALGGVAGYACAAAAVTRVVANPPPPAPRAMAVTGMLHALSIGVALGAVSLIANVESWVAWPLGGFAGIGAYLAVVGIEYSLVAGARPGGG